MGAESLTNPSSEEPTIENIIDKIGQLHAQLRAPHEQNRQELQTQIKERTSELLSRKPDIDDILLYDSVINGGDLLIAIEEAIHPYQIIAARDRVSALEKLAYVLNLEYIYSALYAKLLAIYEYDYNHIQGLIVESSQDYDNSTELQSLLDKIDKSLRAIQEVNNFLYEGYNPQARNEVNTRKYFSYQSRYRRFTELTENTKLEEVKDQLNSARYIIKEKIYFVHKKEPEALTKKLESSSSYYFEIAERCASIYASLYQGGIKLDNFESVGSLRGLLNRDNPLFPGNKIRNGELFHDIDIFFTNYAHILKFKQAELENLLQKLDYSAGKNPIGEVFRQGVVSKHLTDQFHIE